MIDCIVSVINGFIEVQEKPSKGQQLWNTHPFSSSQKSFSIERVNWQWWAIQFHARRVLCYIIPITSMAVLFNIPKVRPYQIKFVTLLRFFYSIIVKCQFLESRVVDTEEETYVEVTELRMADMWVESWTKSTPGRWPCSCNCKTSTIHSNF